jgi:hypothetical protein
LLRLPPPILLCPAAARLFYWTRLAYRNDEALDYKWINGTEAKRLFNLQHVEALWDTDTDTHCVIGWSDTQAVVAFRWAHAAHLHDTRSQCPSQAVATRAAKREHGGLPCACP